jgi:hypothetical protein
MDEDKTASNVTRLKVLETPKQTFKKEIDESVGQVLEEVRRLFDAGQITGIAVLMTTTDEDTYSCWSKQSDNHMMLAALTRAMVRMAKE